MADQLNQKLYLLIIQHAKSNANLNMDLKVDFANDVFRVDEDTASP